MVNLKKIIFITSALLLIGGVSTSFGKSRGKIPLKSITKNLKNKISNHSRQMKKIKGNIISLERKLASGNARYIAILKKRIAMEGDINRLRNKVRESRKFLLGRKKDIRRIMSKVIVSSVDDETELEDLMQRKILEKSLKYRLQMLNLSIAKNDKVYQELKVLLNRYQEYEVVEKELMTTMGELEKNKKNNASRYISIESKKQKYQGEYDKLRTTKYLARSKARLKSNIGFRFSSPLKDYIGMKYKKRGVTFTFKGSRPVYSTRGGKVIYSGSLANYGNVVMIDHGKSIHSVILGPYKIKVTKGMHVKAGAIIGYTKKSRNESGKIYFDVRKKDVVQNTIHLLDLKTVAKNSHK